MYLPGRLRLTTLGDVLGLLHRENATGVLELIEDSGYVHRVHLARGLLGPIESNRAGSRLGEILKRRGVVDSAAIDRAVLQTQGVFERRLGEALMEAGAMNEDQLVAALAVQRRERLEELFGFVDARLAFRVAGTRTNGATAPLGPREFLVGRARARDRQRSAAAPARRRDPVRSRALATLGLGDAADASSVQRAFRSLASRMHPDRFPEAAPADRAELVRRFAELSAAYHALVA